MMADDNGSPNIIITNADNFYERLDTLLTKKIESLKVALEEREAIQGDNDWLPANVFCSRNEISPATLSRYVRDNRVEKKVMSRRNIRYRWKGKTR